MGATAVVLRVSMSAIAGSGTAQFTQAMGAPNPGFGYDAEDLGTGFTLVVEPTFGGEISWTFSTQATIKIVIVGYFNSGVEDRSPGYVPVDHRQVFSTVYGIGIAAGPQSSMVVDATQANSQVPSTDVNAVMATVGIAAPAGTKVLAGPSASQLSLITVLGSAQGFVTTPIPVDSSSTFVVQLKNQSDAPVAGHVGVAVDGWFSARSSMYMPLFFSGSTVATNELLEDRVAKTIQLRNGMEPPRFNGITAAQVVVTLTPATAGASFTYPGTVRAWPSKTRPPVLPQQAWVGTAGSNYQSFTTTLPMAADGTIQLQYDDTSNVDHNFDVKATIHVLGYYCDRDQPTSVSISSETHTGPWTPNKEAKITWSEAYTASSASGVAGYAVDIDEDAYTEPEPVVTQTSTEFTTRVQPGRRWVHVRPIAKDGTPGRTEHYALQVQADCTSLGASSYVPLPSLMDLGSVDLRNAATMYSLGGAGSIPSNAAAVRLNVQVRPRVPTGFALFYAGDQQVPAGSGQIIFEDEPVQSSFTVGLGEYDGVAGRMIAHVVGDATVSVRVAGYFVENPGQGYTPLTTSKRVYGSPYMGSGARVNSATVNPTVLLGGGASGIPTSGVSAVVATIHVSDIALSPEQRLRVGATSTTRVEVLSAAATTDAQSAQVTIPVAADGTFTFQWVNTAGSPGSGGTTALGHVYVDVHGWFSTKGGEYHQVPEASRRIATTTIGPNSVKPITVAGQQGLPSDGISAIEAALHVAPGQTTGGSYLATRPMGSTQAWGTSAVDFWDDSATTDAALHTAGLHATLGRTGSNPAGFELYNSATPTGTHTVYVDALGYYCRPTPKITSTSHPDEGIIYPSTAVQASWTVNDDPSVLAGYQVAWSTDPAFTFGTPAVTQTGTTYTRSAPAEGTYFLYVRAVGTTGVPSETARYRFQTGAAVDARLANGSGLGLEPWWSFVDRPVGPEARASVNVANGNLVVQQNDLPPIQGTGDVALSLRRTYNSQSTTASLIPGFTIGDGWTMAIADVGGSGPDLVAGLPLGDRTNLLSNSVTVTDRDGTAHEYKRVASDLNVDPILYTDGSLTSLQTAVDGLTGNLKSALGSILAGDLTNLKGLLGGLGIGQDATGLAICSDARFRAPEGVHQALRRFIVIDFTSSAPGSKCQQLKDQAGSQAVAFGYATVRPDRVTQSFNLGGQLTNLTDAAGNSLNYEYLAGTLRRVVDARTGRAMTISWNPLGGATVTDPAGRVVTYETTLVGGVAYLTKVQATKGIGGPELETWEYRYSGQGVNCGEPGRLCEIKTPRVLDANDTGATTPVEFKYENRRVVRIVESGGIDRDKDTEELHPDNPAASSPDAVVRPFTILSYAADQTDVTRGTQAVRYRGIDKWGRVFTIAKYLAGSPGTYLEETRRTWDDTDRPCTLLADAGRSNNLCVQTQIGQNGDANRTTTWTYNPEGNVLRERRSGDQTTGGDAIKTWSYQTFSYMADGTVQVADDGISGPGGQLLGGLRKADPLYTVTQNTGMLSARGNAAGAAWPSYLTSHRLDANPAAPLGTVGFADPTLPPQDPNLNTCGVGNSGLICSTSSPEGIDAGYAYNEHGQLLGQNIGTTYVGYDYFDTSDTVRGGWLKLAKDAHLNQVRFAYDTAGNVTAVWDRNAYVRAGGNPVDLDEATQTAYNSGKNGTGPWRWPSSETRPATDDDAAGHGAKTSWTRDAHGNIVATISPRGAAAGSNDFNVTAVYDARDRKVRETIPTNPVGTTKWAYDMNGNNIRVVDAKQAHTGAEFDGAGRRTTEYFTRSEATPACDSVTDSLLLKRLDVPAGTIVCDSTTTYDAFGSVKTTTDAAGTLTRTTSYDRLGRVIRETWPSDAGLASTGTAYDLNGNKTVQCAAGAPAATTSSCSTYASAAGVLPAFVTLTTYDKADRPIATRYDRRQVDRLGQPTGTTKAVVTRTTYDTNGNKTTEQNPNGATTVHRYNLLNREFLTEVPRSSGETLKTSRMFDASGNTVAVLAPADASELGAVDYQGRKVSVTGYLYDEAQRLTTTISAAQTTDPAQLAALVPQVPTPGAPAAKNIRTTQHYDPDGHVLYVYGPRAFEAGIADPDERWMRRTDYDNAGRAVREWQPQALAATADTCPAASAAHKPTPTVGAPNPTYPNGIALCRTVTGYDQVGNITSTTSAGGKSTSTLFTPDNKPTVVTGPDPDGTNQISITTTFDAAGRPTSVKSPSADLGDWLQTTTYSPDGHAQVVRGQRVGGAILTETQNQYDLGGRKTKETQVVATPGVGSLNGPSTNVVTDTVYLSDGLTLSVTQPASGTANVRTSYDYDAAGNPTSVKSPNANKTTSTIPWPTVQYFSLDNQLIETREPIEISSETSTLQVRRTVFDLDPAGRKLTETVTRQTMAGTDPAGAFHGSKAPEPGRAVRYVYQAPGWLQRESNAANATDGAITYVHNLDGTLASASDATTNRTTVNVAATWELDGRPIQATTTVGDDPFSTVTGTWRPDGERASQTVLTNGQTTRQDWQHNQAGLVTNSSVQFPDGTSETATFKWTSAATIDDAHYATGAYGDVYENREYTPDGQLSSITAGGVTHSYTYDGIRRLEDHTVSGLSSANQSFDYDHASRVTAADGSTIGWDPNSNRTDVGSAHTDYRADNTPLTSNYDAAGRQTGTGTPGCSYSYDFLNRTTAVTGASCSQRAAYLHDPLSRQIIDLAGSGATNDAFANDMSSGSLLVDEVKENHTVFDLLGDVATTTALWNTIGVGTKTNRTDYAGTDAGPWALRTTGSSGAGLGTQALLSDGQGSVSVVRNASGTKCSRIYDAFGHPRSGTTPCSDTDTLNQLWYRNGQQDTATSTYKYGARRYDPKTATWTTPDSARPGAPVSDLGIATDPLIKNRYTYVNGDPINVSDPSGHRRECGTHKKQQLCAGGRIPEASLTTDISCNAAAAESGKRSTRECTAQARAIQRLKSNKRSISDRASGFFFGTPSKRDVRHEASPCKNNISGHPDGEECYYLDILVNKKSAVEVKLWEGPQTIATVNDQLSRYERNWHRDYGQDLKRNGELNDMGFVDTWTDVDGVEYVVWAPIESDRYVKDALRDIGEPANASLSGHVYFAPLDSAPNEVRERAKSKNPSLVDQFVDYFTPDGTQTRSCDCEDQRR